MTGYRVTITRLDDVALINLRCSEHTASTISNSASVALPVSAFELVHSDKLSAVRLSPDQWWVRTTLDQEQSTFERIKDATRNEFAAVTLISDHFQGFEISGEDVDAVLSQATSVDLRTLAPGTVTRGKFARSGATIFVVDTKNTAQIFVESSYSDYIQAYLARTAGQFN